MSDTSQNVVALEAEIEILKMTQTHSDGVRNEKQKRINTLEAKVKELEDTISAMRPGSVRTTIHSPTRFMDDARAALTRIG